MELMPGPIPAPQVEQRVKAALLTSVIPGADGVGWRRGVMAWPESSPSYRVALPCTDEVADYGDEAEFGPVAAQPFTIQTVTRCPKGSLEEMVERARRRTQNITSQALAYELWTGEASALEPWTLPDNHVYGGLANPRPAASGTADEGPYVNPFLNGADMLADVVTDATAAMGLVEAAVAEKMAGGPVFLHVPGEFVTGMGADLRDEGNRLLTPMGSRVIADAGYPGPGAAGTDLVIYGSGPVTVWLGDITVYDQDSWVVDHNTNRVAVRAERDALIWFDPQTLVGCTVSA